MFMRNFVLVQEKDISHNKIVLVQEKYISLAIKLFHVREKNVPSSEKNVQPHQQMDQPKAQMELLEQWNPMYLGLSLVHMVPLNEFVYHLSQRKWCI